MITTTIETRIIEPCAMSFGFPLSARSRNFFFYLGMGEGAMVLLCSLPPFLEKGFRTS